MILPAQLHLTLPVWVHDAVDMQRTYPKDADKVGLAISLSANNVKAGSGGPFGAAVFDPYHRIVAVGVNRVVPQSCSLAHAETMAFALAQQRAQRARLNQLDDGSAIGPFTLATSAQPCCQCFGATIWAGIDRLLIGARAEDVERLTHFDEGPLPADWQGELEKRGIEVVRDVMRDQACEVLRAYGEGGGAHY